MLKLRIALSLALVVGALTLINGIVYDARFMTIIYRVLISIIIFGIAGYFLGTIVEKFLKILVTKSTDKGQHINVVSQEDVSDELVPENTFSPFSPEQFEQIERPK